MSTRVPSRVHPSEPLADRPLTEPHHDRLSPSDPAYSTDPPGTRRGAAGRRRHVPRSLLGIDGADGGIPGPPRVLLRVRMPALSLCRLSSPAGAGSAPYAPSRTRRARNGHEHERHLTGSRMVVGIGRQVVPARAVDRPAGGRTAQDRRRNPRRRPAPATVPRSPYPTYRLRPSSRRTAPPPVPKTNGLAIASLICSCAGLFFLPALPGHHPRLRRPRRRSGGPTERSVATGSPSRASSSGSAGWCCIALGLAIGRQQDQQQRRQSPSPAHRLARVASA